MNKSIVFISIILLASCNFKTEKISKIAKAKSVTSVCDTSNFNVYNYFSKGKITRYYREIERFRKEDSVKFPAKNSVLFVGSSSIRKWKNLETDFRPIPVIRRGFGGSTFPELIYYSKDLIFKYHPNLIVIYEGDNDQYFLTASEIMRNACYLEKLIHSKLPNSKIFFISVKPSPARRNKEKSMIITNNNLKKYAEKTPNTYFIDVWDKMLDNRGKIKSYIYRADSLHLNKKGYKIWTSIIKSELKIYYVGH